MTNNTGSGRTVRDARRPGPRRIWLASTLLALGLFGLAACGPSGDDGVATAGGDETQPSAAASSTGDPFQFAQCMRDNGIEDWPDPNPDGGAPDRGGSGGPARVIAPEGVDPGEVQEAMQHCRQYLPNGGEPPRNEADQEQRREFAQCMRDNGVPDFPDPPADGGNMGGVPGGIDVQSAEYEAAFEACRALLGGGGPAAGSLR